MNDEQDILISEDGHVRFVYTDLLDDVFGEEERHTKRASHVEPHPTRAGWLADMRPSGGPILGSGNELNIVPEEPDMFTFVVLLEPFATRQEALEAEREWLRRERGL